MDYTIIATVISLLLTFVASVFGAKYQLGKGKLEKISALLSDVIVSVQDDKVSEEECQKIAADAKAVLEAS
jgi:hypothetical protein